MATPSKKTEIPSVSCNRLLGSARRKGRKRSTDEITKTLCELLSLTAKGQMSTPDADQNKRKTRSSTKRILAAPRLPSSTDNPATRTPDQHNPGSPILRGRRKRPNSGETSNGEPANKRMAEDKILDAIKAVNVNVTSVENRMKSFSTKDDLNKMVDEIKDVKERVLVNTHNIERLFDMRKADNDSLLRKVEQIVENKITTIIPGGPGAAGAYGEEKEHKFLQCRRSVRLWPISEVAELDIGVRTFLKRYLKIPAAMADSIAFEHLERQVQPRRSKIHKEVLVRFCNTQTRDTVQSFAANLADANGNSGL